MKKVLFIFLTLFLFPVFILAAEVVELNTASLAELDLLVGIGPTIAQRIIDGRPYASVDDLLKVKGIGEKTLQDIKAQGLVTINPNFQAPIPNETTKPAATTTQNPTPTTYPAGIIISEMLPSPDGADEFNEFIELHNTTGSQINISGWRLQDSQGTQGGYMFKQNSAITAGGYMALMRSETKILLNNDQDSIALLFPNGTATDTVSYTNAPSKKSYNKTASGWQWSNDPTPGAKNTVTATPAKAVALPKVKKTDTKTNVAVAAISGPQPLVFGATQEETRNPWFIFYLTGALTIILTGIFLAYKYLIQKNHERS